MKSFLLTTALAALAATAAHAETWVPDPAHTEVVIGWNHAGFSFQTAKFGEATGSLDFTPGDVAGASADFTVSVASIDSGVPDLDAHLQSADFFDVENYPTIRFVSTSVEQTGDMTVTATGDLTVKDLTAPATFEITVHQMGEHPVGAFYDFYKGEWLGLTATATIKRSDFGVDALIPVGSDEVTITINSEMKAGS